MRCWLMVLAVLSASVTYQAGLNPPGGFWQQDDNQGHVAGMPVLQSKFPKRYNVFFYFNATSFVTSVVIIILLMNESFYHSEVRVEALEIIVVLDMVGLMGAYIAGCTRTVSSSIYIIVLTVVVFLYVVYTAQFLPKLYGASSSRCRACTTLPGTARCPCRTTSSSRQTPTGLSRRRRPSAWPPFSRCALHRPSHASCDVSM